jgi:ribonuclease D
VARSINRPLFKVIGDKTLLAIASSLPKNLDELGRIPGMSNRQVKRHGHKLLRTVERGLAAEPIYPPRAPRPREDYLERLEALRRWRKRAAQNMGVKSDIVLPRDLLNSLAEHNPGDSEELKTILSEVPWRYNRFGEQILEVLSRCS